jgi:hypothetical protein
MNINLFFRFRDYKHVNLSKYEFISLNLIVGSYRNSILCKFIMSFYLCLISFENHHGKLYCILSASTLASHFTSKNQSSLMFNFLILSAFGFALGKHD